ncbi:alpha/beta hydrolase family protein [Neorhizobium sp. DAR64872/K0K18]|uniref:alpha/beta hydrolase family protein n=1 Tax=Neorhizobium sp. DAR64872/K0K18 TaxID=3421958 RepID=UPI003D29ADB7
MTENYRDANMDSAVMVQSVRSVRLSAPGRGEELQLRVTSPLQGTDLPCIVFSHGFGSSMDAYAPLAEHWAANGFVVIQPTFLDSRRVALREDDPRYKSIWRIRVEDLRVTLDSLQTVVELVPGLKGRVDQSNVAAAGHSFGGQTTSMLLGARMIADGGPGLDLADDRIKAGVLLASGGKGGADLSDLGQKITPYLNSGFDHMTKPALVVVGDEDKSPLTNRGPGWFRDPYDLSPGQKSLLTLCGGEHMLGGISGYGAAETTDENPARVSLVQKMTTAYLKRELLGDEKIWHSACLELSNDEEALGKIENKNDK